MGNAMDLNELLQLATDTFAGRLAQVGDDQWDMPSPCEGWTVSDLVAHVVGGNAMAVALIEGATADEAVALFTATELAADVTTQFADGAEAQITAFAAEGVAAQVLHHPMGDLPGEVVHGFRVGDLTLHAWDLSRAIGADETLPEQLVEAVYANLEPMAPMIASIGVFGDGPSGNVSAETSAQDRLLDLAGRRP